MKLATSTGDLIPYVQDIYELLDAFEGTGFRYLDMNFYGTFTDAILLRDDYLDECRRIREYAEKKGFSFVQAHAPNGNGLRRDDKYDTFILKTRRCVEACEVLGIPHAVLHSGIDGPLPMDEYCRRNRDFYRLFFDVTERTGVSLLIENSMPNNMKENTFFMYGREMREFLEYVDHPLLGACWDTGHANTFTNQYGNISDLGRHLKAVHMADNFGQRDDHIAPMQGTLNVDEVMCALLDNGFEGPFTFEADHVIRPMRAWPNYRHEFEPTNGRAPLLSSPSKALKISAECLLYEIGRFVLSSYGVFEG